MWIALACLLSTGCDDGSPGGGGQDWCAQPDGPYTGVRELFAAACDAMERCELGLELGYAFRCRQECVQVFAFGLGCGISEGSDRDRWNRQIVERQVIYDQDQGGACAEWLGSADCAVIEGIFSGGGLGDEDSPGQPASCQAAFEVYDPDDPPPPGSVAEGEACQEDEDCIEGLTCQPSADGQTCAMCAPLPGAGEPCHDYACSLQAWCDYTLQPPLCQARVQDGNVCTSHEHCLSGRCVASLCMTPRADGQACAQHAECESQLCHLGSCTSYREEGGACDADEVCTTGRCYQGACIRVRQIGEACEDDAQCWDICFRGACDQTHDAGDPCDVVDDCYDPQYMICYQGVCVPLHQLPEGAPCAVDGDCATNRCLDGACFTMLENGAACTRPEECAQVVCDQGFCGLADGATCWGHEMCRSMRCLNYTSCVSPRADGEPCVSPEECVSWLCLEGACFTLGEPGDPCTSTVQCEDRYFCDPESSQCQPRRDAGGACTDDDACSQGFCDPAALVCGHPSGEACGWDSECQGFCDGALCADARADGASCERDEQCIHYCSNGACRLSKPYGSECRADEECEGGMCVYAWSSMRCAAPGQCFENEQCEAAQYCDDEDWPATCAPRKADGEPCDEYEDQCLHFCRWSTCVAKLPTGEDCDADEDCVGGLCANGYCSEPGLCNSDEDCAAGEYCDHRSYPSRCTAPRPDGSGCEDDWECQSGWCSPSSETCKLQPRLGEACGSFECTQDAYCLNGACTARKRPGAACDSSFSSDLECLAPAFCRRGQCEVMRLECTPAPAGATCTLMMVCEEHAYCDFMDGFTCKPRSRLGQACESLMWANACMPGSFCGGAGVCEAYAQAGQSCAGKACEPATLYCDPATSTCQALKFQGQPCQEDEECLGEYCEYFDSDDYRCGPPCRLP